MNQFGSALSTMSHLFDVLKSAVSAPRKRQRMRSAFAVESLEIRQLLTAAFGFEYGTIASDLSPTLRFFGSPNAGDAPFTIIRYGEGQVTSLNELGVGYLEAIDLTFEFGSSDPAAPVEAVTLAEFDNGLRDGIANQIYRPDANDQPKITVYNAGVAIAEGRVQEISLATTPDGEVTSPRSTFIIDRAVGSDTRIFDELVAASQGTKVIPFNLTAFDLAGSWAGIGDASIFESTGVSLFTASTNRAPTNISLSNNSIAENQPVATVVGVLTTTDPDGAGTFTYSLVSGTGSTDNASFTISGNQLRTNSAFDFEAKSSYSVRLQTRDAGGLTFQKQFTIQVSDVLEGINAAPTNITLSPGSVVENQPAGTLAGTFSTTDPNGVGNFVYTLVSGAGDSGNSQFRVVNNQLLTAAVFSSNAQSSYSIRVQTRDAGGLTFQKQLTVQVTNQVANTTEIKLSSTSIAENRRANSLVGVLRTASNVGRVSSYSLVPGSGDTDNASFIIVGNRLRTRQSLDYEAKSSLSIRVQARTADNRVISEGILVISVKDVRERQRPPAKIELSNSRIDENRPAGTVLGTFSSKDANGGAFTYQLVPSPFRSARSGNVNFEISGNQLKAKSTFDFEKQSSYRIYVQSTDSSGLSRRQHFTIRVNNLNEAPTQVTATNPTIVDNSNRSRIRLRVNDPDRRESFRWALVAGQGDTNNALFTINARGVLTPKFKPDYGQKTSYTVRVRVTDSAGHTLESALNISVQEGRRSRISRR